MNCLFQNIPGYVVVYVFCLLFFNTGFHGLMFVKICNLFTSVFLLMYQTAVPKEKRFEFSKIIRKFKRCQKNTSAVRNVLISNSDVR